jgi:hypothetical protein
MLQRLHQFRRWAGVDRAVFFSNAAQMLRLVTGPITMALVLRYLTPEIQGYFYAFSGVLAMQIFLEMGFSQNILQFAAHEFAKLRFTPKGAIEGDPVAKSRLLSLGRLAAGYYAVAALVFLVAIGIGGHVFFTVSGSHGVHWQGAWWIVAAATACALAINPAWALLEGCNQVAMIAQYRFGYVFVGQRHGPHHGGGHLCHRHWLGVRAALWPGLSGHSLAALFFPVSGPPAAWPDFLEAGNMAAPVAHRREQHERLFRL